MIGYLSENDKPGKNDRVEEENKLPSHPNQIQTSLCIGYLHEKRLNVYNWVYGGWQFHMKLLYNQMVATIFSLLFIELPIQSYMHLKTLAQRANDRS